MAIGQTWTDPDTIEIDPLDVVTSTFLNAVLANINAATAIRSIGVGEMQASTGSAAPLQIGATGVLGMAFDGSNDEAIRGSFIVPLSWTTLNAFIWWTPASSSGNVYWQFFGDDNADATSVGQGSDVSTIVAAPTAGTWKRTQVGTSLSAVGGTIFNFTLFRLGSNGSDTLDAVDALVSAVEFRRAT